MTVLFRADASLEIGSGHVMRCLVLADALVAEGAHCIFVCREHRGHLGEAIRQRGHAVCLLPNKVTEGPDDGHGTAHSGWLGADQAVDAAETLACFPNHKVDRLIVDHYGLDARWERQLRGHVERILVIDDIADRTHDCDVLLDQNLGKGLADYRDLIPEDCVTLFGPQYALLAPVFKKERDASVSVRASRPVRRILITMGGVDKDDMTSWVLSELRACALPQEVAISVVMGRTAPWVERVRRVAEVMPWRTEVFVDINDMASLMGLADLAIGAAGSTSWERCCLGVPSVMLVLALNQAPIAAALHAAGAAFLVDHGRADPGAALRRSVERLVTDHTERVRMSAAAATVTDGDGAARVRAILLAHTPIQ